MIADGYTDEKIQLYMDFSMDEINLLRQSPAIWNCNAGSFPAYEDLQIRSEGILKRQDALFHVMEYRHIVAFFQRM